MLYKRGFVFMDNIRK